MASEAPTAPSATSVPSTTELTLPQPSPLAQSRQLGQLSYRWDGQVRNGWLTEGEIYFESLKEEIRELGRGPKGVGKSRIATFLRRFPRRSIPDNILASDGSRVNRQAFVSQSALITACKYLFKPLTRHERRRLRASGFGRRMRERFQENLDNGNEAVSKLKRSLELERIFLGMNGLFGPTASHENTQVTESEEPDEDD